MFKGLSNLTSLLKEVRQIQGRTDEMQQKLGQLRVEGRAGGEMVTVQADGLQRIVAIKIQPSLLQSPDAEMLEDLFVAAANQALDKSRELAAEEFSKITQMQLPGLSEMMSKFGLGGGGSGAGTT
jgi:DNA-binding YbaB/EbfC family protein